LFKALVKPDLFQNLIMNFIQFEKFDQKLFQISM